MVEGWDPQPQPQTASHFNGGGKKIGNVKGAMAEEKDGGQSRNTAEL
jgi:hypothetical protein